ncbi:MAG: hypothetical protein V4850_04355 [Myxococcota bacterium]
MSTEPRARRVLDALGGTSPEALRAAARVSPAPIQTMLEAVADALDSADPEAALGAVMQGSAADTTEAQKLLGALSALLGTQLDTITATAVAAEEPLAQVEAARRALLAAKVPTPPEGAPEADVALAALLARALDIAGDEAPVRAVRSALAESRSLAAIAKDVLDGARRDPERAAHAAATLEARVRGLERALADAETAAAGLARVPALVAEFRALAEARGELGAVAELALVEAGLQERLHGLGDTGVQARWQATFDAAVRAGQVPLARAAAQRLQMVAIERGDIARVAVLAHRTADLARDHGDVRAEVFARLEEVMALARLPEHRDDAKMLVAEVITRAEASGEALLAARARLTRGQLLEHLGDAAGARAAYRALLAAAKADSSYPREVGRAALHLGRLELADQPARARKDLGLAQVLGRRMGEWLLYGPAVVALIEHYTEHDDRAPVGPLLRELAVEAPRIGGADGQRAFEHVVGELVKRWGRPAVDAVLAG